MNLIRSLHWHRFGAFFALACVAALTPPLGAQQSPPAENGKNNLPLLTLETFNVAGKQVESYQADSIQMGAFRDASPVNVPLTINVLTREVLDAQAARGLYDALKNTAGVTRAQITGSAYDNLAIRGILVENRGNYRLNGSLPIINLADITMENKERVEVLKGTSSLYYGFIPPSGVINLVTKRPLPKPLTTLTFNGNSNGGYGGAIDVSRTVGSKQRLGLRVNAASSQEDQGIERTAGNRDFVSLAVDLRLNSQLFIRGDVEHLRKNVTETPAILLPNINGILTIPAIPGNTTNLGGEWQRYDATMTNWWTRVDYLINPQWTIYAEVGNAHTNRNRIFSQFIFGTPQATTITSGAGNVQTGFFLDQDYRNSNYRLEAYGRFRTGTVRHDLSFGYTANTRKQNPRSQGANVNIPQNFYAPTALPVTGPSSATITQVPSEIEDTGLYVSDRLALLADRLQFIAGLRLTDYTSTTVTTRYEVKRESNPMFSALFKPTEKTSVYASYLKGLEAGATAGAAQANAGAVLPPLTSTQYELGLKAQVCSGLLVQVGGFEIERPSTFVNASNFLTANGLARYRGVELFVSGEVTKDLSLIASGQMLTARQLNAANTATYEKTPNGLAKYTFSLFGEWRTPLKGLALSLGGYYTGRRPVNDANVAYVGGFTSFSAGASYRFTAGRNSYILRVNGDNITDKNAWGAVGASGTSSLLGVTPPRNIKFSLSTSF